MSDGAGFCLRTQGETLIPDQYLDLLSRETKAVAVVATIGPDGEAQANPVWFDWDGEHLSFSQLNVRQKYKNLMRNPSVSMCIVDPTNPYHYVEIRGVLEEVIPDPDFKLIDELANKYTGLDEFGNKQPDDERYLLKVRPIKVSGMG